MINACRTARIVGTLMLAAFLLYGNGSSTARASFSRFLAVWGFVGYASFAAGCFLELAGVAVAGLISTIPGGLFEIFFAIWLIARGFGSTAVIPVTAPA